MLLSAGTLCDGTSETRSGCQAPGSSTSCLTAGSGCLSPYPPEFLGLFAATLLSACLNAGQGRTRPTWTSVCRGLSCQSHSSLMLRTSDPRRMLSAREAGVLRRSEETPDKMNLSFCTLMLPKRATVQSGRKETNNLLEGCPRRCARLSANGDSSRPPHRKSSLCPGLIDV